MTFEAAGLFGLNTPVKPRLPRRPDPCGRTHGGEGLGSLRCSVCKDKRAEHAAADLALAAQVREPSQGRFTDWYCRVVGRTPKPNPHAALIANAISTRPWKA